MILFTLNPQYEAIFNPRNIDEDCNKIADEINDVARMQIKEILAVGMYKQAVTLYLQLLQSMVNHFVDDEHCCYFDDMYNEMSKKIEKEADSYAKEMLIPSQLWKSSGLRITSSASDIKDFASKYRISPAIPAGRLRYENKNYYVFTNLIGNGMVRKLFEK